MPHGLGAKASADDLVQDTHLKAIQRFPKFQGHSAAEFRGWLRQILCSVSRFLALWHGCPKRDVSRERSLEEAGGSAAFDLAGDPSLYPALARREDIQSVQRALILLSLGYQDVLQQHYHDGRTFRAIGSGLERSEGAARQLCLRALHQLRTHLNRGEMSGN